MLLNTLVILNFLPTEFPIKSKLIVHSNKDELFTVL